MTMPVILSKKQPLFVLLIIFVMLLPGGVYGQKAGRNRRPLTVRHLLFKLSPDLQKNEYRKVIKTILDYQKKSFAVSGKSAGAHPEIFFILGNCHMQLEEYAPAAAAYERAVELAPDNATAWMNLARAEYELKKYGEAGRDFSRAYEVSENKTPEPLYYSAVNYLLAENYPKSIKIFKRLIKTYPEAVPPEWQEHFVQALLAAGRAREALPHILELAKILTGKKQARWQEILLYQYLQLNMTEKALKLAYTLTEISSGVAKWWQALAHIQLQRNCEKEALAALTIYAFLTPLTPEQEQLMADLDLQLGIPAKALPLYKHCLEKNGDKKILARLLIAYRQLGAPGKALAELEAIKLDPDNDADLLMLKGELLYARQNYSKAAAVFKDIARSDGRQSGRAWLLVGYAAWQADDLKTGRMAFKQALKFKRERPAAARALKQLGRTISNLSAKE